VSTYETERDVSLNEPTRVEVELLLEAAARGWTPPRLPENQLDFFASMLSITSDGVKPVYDENDVLVALSGIRLKRDDEK
jgi:hypothetical protein